jgi:hypothetical protein
VPGDHAELDGLGADGQEPVNRAVVNMGKAMGACERKLACGPSPFYRRVHGDAEALDASERFQATLSARGYHR